MNTEFYYDFISRITGSSRGILMKDTALVRMTIDEIAKQKNIPLDAAFDLFYNSKLCELLSDRETGLFTYAPQDLAEMVDSTFQ